MGKLKAAKDEVKKFQVRVAEAQLFFNDVMEAKIDKLIRAEYDLREAEDLLLGARMVLKAIESARAERDDSNEPF